MSGVVLRLALFLLPFILFLLWLWVMRRTRFGREQIDPRTARRITLSGLGLIAATVVGFVVFALTSEGDQIGRDYVPPHMVDGKIQPGEFKDRESEDEQPDG